MNHPSSESANAPHGCRIVGVCSECGGPLYEVLWQGDWHATPCLPCKRRSESDEFVRELLERQAEAVSMTAGATFDNFDADLPHQRRGLLAARRFVDVVERRRPDALILYAHKSADGEGYGTGKTHLASAIARSLTLRGWRVKTWAAPDLMQQIRASYSDGAEETELDIVRDAATCDLLVLDDVGKEHVGKDPGWYQEKMFMLLNARSARGPMVVTTNLNPLSELSPWIGGAAFSRLWGMARVGKMAVDMCGPDYRLMAR